MSKNQVFDDFIGGKRGLSSTSGKGNGKDGTNAYVVAIVAITIMQFTTIMKEASPLCLSFQNI